MRVVIMGCGRTGSLLAVKVANAGHQVAVIDWSLTALGRLPDAFPGDAILGNGVDQDVLRAAGIERADVFVAATSGDNRNIMASQVAQQIFRIPKIICRIKDPIRAEIYGRLGFEVDCRTLEGVKVILDILEEPEQNPSFAGQRSR